MRAVRGKIPTVRLKSKHVWRCVPSAFYKTALESGPSFTKDRRYSVQGEFGAVYFSGSKTLAQLEATQRGGEDMEDLSYLAFELTVDKLVDFTSKETRAYFGVRLDDLVKPRTAQGRYEVTQALARRVYDDQLNGIIAPSIHDPHGQKPDWLNIALYPAHLLRVYLYPVQASRTD